ncbi:hypothetical protein [Haloarcula regularis]|uniref:hypothetical protein n=1 Tax=Haloarcula regularis TaxID=3033392 RepID=UPI0023E7AD48|nr:hypothetical protein [Halomicroarcula sp. SYNS111]
MRYVEQFASAIVRPDHRSIRVEDEFRQRARLEHRLRELFLFDQVPRELAHLKQVVDTRSEFGFRQRDAEDGIDGATQQPLEAPARRRRARVRQ